MTISPVPSPSLPRERIPLPEGLTRLSDGALRVDGVDGTAVINPAAGSQAGGVSVETGLRVLQALGGTYLPTVGPAAPAALSAPSPQDAAPSRAAALRRSDLRSMAPQPSGIVPAEPSDETTLLRPITPISPISGSPQEAAPEPEPEPAPELEQEPQPAPVPLEVPSPAAADSPTEVASPAQAPSSDEAPSSAEAATPAESDSSTDSAPELLETGVWEDPDDPVEPQQQLSQTTEAAAEGLETGDVSPFPDYPEPEPGSGRRRRGAHRAPTAPSASSGGSPTANTPTAPDNSKSKQPQPVREPQPLEALPNTEVVSASEAALIAAPPVRASICPQGHPNPPELRECLICAQPLTGVFSYVRRPALATLTLSTGAAVEVAGDVVIGRAPQVQAGGDPHIVALVPVASPQHMVSRSHLMLTTSGWSVLAQDLGSSNGTVLARPGATPVLLGSGMPTPVFMGDLMDVGDGVTLRIDPPSWLRLRSG
ncbi:hypothetical protein HMPREF0059_00857 [Actinomyces viscosus C505]|uniref:FHA domain-containing protein n=1 Tax=Actinomyces viscosus C505 TaxID=562973 RepID=F2UXQ5_ACTVI|nr:MULTISPECIES: hypothetical protein [Actinomyces]EGE38006.1 hypothetical protein HMPREF0059_00857 [Actinomyces viscosus C505]